MIIAALCFLTGIVLVQQLSDLPHQVYFMFIGVVLGISIWQKHWRAMFLLLGMFWAIIFAMIRLADRLPERLEGNDIPVAGRIIGLPITQEKSVRFDFAPIRTEARLPSRIRLTWYQPESAVKAGQSWRFTVKLKRPHGAVNPGGFDYERWLFTEGIGATGYIRSAPPPELIEDAADTDIAGLRQTIADRFSGLLTNATSLALIRALAIGDGSQITQAQWDVFRKTGATHLIVISGSHIGLIAGFVYFLTIKGWARTGLLRWPPPRVAAIIAMFAAAFYAFLAGFAVPTRRAVIMLAIAMSAVIWQRHTRPFNTLAAALFAVLIADPLAVLSAGFWLSFLAVGLIIFAISGRLEKPRLVSGALKLHWVTSLGLSPFLLFLFQQISFIAPLANLLAVPIISVVVLPLVLLGMLILPLSSTVAGLLLLPADHALRLLMWLLNEMAKIPVATISHPAPSYWTLFAAIPGALLLLAPSGTPSRWLGGVMLMPLMLISADRPAPGEIRMALLDVGQGLAVALQTSHHWLVYDTGPQFSAESDMGRSAVLPYLQAQGADKIDTLIVSHGDNDHIGGAHSILSALSVTKILTSAPASLALHAPSLCKAGQTWQWDGVNFTMLAPKQLDPATDNNNSCVLKIESAHGAILLTGDIEASAESWLVNQYGNGLRADILVAPHHGSKTSSTRAFLDTVQPQYVLIPSGYRNQFGHPHPSVLERYRDLDIPWLTSAGSGAILVELTEHQMSVQSYRELDKKYWRAMN
ncbi:DNA internalization-related competence protein ComEC/Rec2 [Methylomicrobium sp. Wu6]|uniref:DNA internalization-related competence protein ComEC/Rec2 n=1 Tax=Methylomicrobium sp. Wu6 TaxID=3107928 RepID=UPI002DD6ACA7|nr:DNA internalization-related competence protein ComEC/Rec2 [Methylomicrobium sp. Wu6]MEC4748365.1 DNA internalization-related competence protein ComEC/Rec2 [Methylomicrobium sp. Wu6]